MSKTVKKLGVWSVSIAILLVLVISMSPQTQAADAPQAIYAYPTQFPFGEGIATFDVNQLTWNVKKSHSYYDKAYTSSPGATTNLTAAEKVASLWGTGTSGFYNGTATPEHVVLDGGTIRFLGYGISPYMDYYYTNTSYSQGFESVTFTFNPRNLNFHSFSEAGFLFNGSFDSSERYTGYALILRCSNTSGMMSNGTASLLLVYIDNQLLRDTNGNFRTGYECEVLGTYRTGIKDIRVGAEAVSFGVRLDRNVATGSFRLFVDGSEVASVTTPRAGGIGFGFYSGYYSHNCPILSAIEFNNVKLTAYVDPTPTTAQVQFLDAVTQQPIANPQTLNNLYATDKFRVVAPQTLTHGDGSDAVTYQYNHSNVSSLDPIELKADPTENIVKLYYTVKTGEISYVDIDLSASIEGVKNNGSLAAPVKVNVGDIIDYSIEITHPGGDIGFIPGQKLCVKDTLPAGLTYVTDSFTITGKTYSTVNLGAVGFLCSTSAQDGRETLTWEFDQLPVGETVYFNFAAEVKSVQRLYENKASFTGGGNTSTSGSTFHSGGFTVTEKYQSYYDQTTLKADSYAHMLEGDPYAVPHTNINDILVPDGSELVLWRYYAYSTDGGVTKTVGEAPSPLFIMAADKEVILYFVKDTALTINYYEYTDAPTTTPIKTALKTRISPTETYYMNVTYMDAVEFNGAQYNFVGYQLPGGAYQEGPIATYPSATISSADLVATQGGNYAINLYFVKSAAVTVRYLDYNSDNILRSPDEQYIAGIDFSGNTFNPLLKPGIAAAVSQGITWQLNGNEYPYYCGYSIGDGPVILKNPPTISVTSNVTLNLYFGTTPVVILGDTVRILYYNDSIGTTPIGDVFIDHLQNGDNTLAAVVQAFGNDWLNKFRAEGRKEGVLHTSTPMPTTVSGDVILYVVYAAAGDPGDPSQPAETGDYMMLWPFTTLTLSVVLAAGAVIIKKRRIRKTDQA